MGKNRAIIRIFATTLIINISKMKRLTVAWLSLFLIYRFHVNVLRSDKFSDPRAGFFFGISF